MLLNLCVLYGMENVSNSFSATQLSCTIRMSIAYKYIAIISIQCNAMVISYTIFVFSSNFTFSECHPIGWNRCNAMKILVYFPFFLVAFRLNGFAYATSLNYGTYTQFTVQTIANAFGKWYSEQR